MNSKNIKSHYNNLKGVKLRDRHKSKIINIRSMNNFIKSMLIRKYATKKVLDIGCGKGGDLKKYLQTGIDYYCGLDIADKSIEEAETRYNFMKNRYKEGRQYNRRDINGVQQVKEEDRKDETDKQVKEDEKDTATDANEDVKQDGIFKADFICADCYNEPFDVKQTFDTISCQFSFHYAFASKKTFNTTLENVNKHLKEDGYFILTIPNSQTLLRRYHNYKNNYGNEYYKVNFKNTYDEIKDMVFGIEYFFNLEEAIETCVEYLVDFKVLKKGLEKYNIECVLHKDMLTFFNANVNDNMELYKDMMKNRLNNDELKVIELYSVAVFKKVSKPKAIDD